MPDDFYRKKTIRQLFGPCSILPPIPIRCGRSEFAMKTWNGHDK